MDKKVIVYSTSTCPYCRMAKDYLTKNNITFVDKNVAEDRVAAKEMIERTGQRGVPVIDIDGTIIVGFNQSEINQALGLSGN